MINKYIAGSGLLFLVLIITLIVKHNSYKKNMVHQKKNDLKLDIFDDIDCYGQFIILDE